MELIERTCKNCTYYPCMRINCGKVCNQHKFEHEKMTREIDKVIEKYYTDNPDCEGRR